MSYIYEGMYLLDNQVVRTDWQQAKSVVTNLIEKHGGKVLTARRWDERRLAYTIAKRKRATYLLAFAELPGSALETFRRDLEITESVLRYLLLRVDEVPEGERELHEAELSSDFVAPSPPDDDAVDDDSDSPIRRGRASDDDDDDDVKVKVPSDDDSDIDEEEED